MKNQVVAKKNALHFVIVLTATHCKLPISFSLLSLLCHPSTPGKPGAKDEDRPRIIHTSLQPCSGVNSSCCSHDLCSCFHFDFLSGKLGGGRLVAGGGLGTAGTFNSSAILSALKHGYRHIDTALLYGNQYAVNDAIRESGIERENLWVTTKVGFFPKNLMLPIPPLLKELLEDGQGYERRNEKTREDLGVKLSLQQLGLSYVDLCLGIK
eukprot:jgi/Bigna1/80355/fgenesh1_pg.70_\